MTVSKIEGSSFFSNFFFSFLQSSWETALQAISSIGSYGLSFSGSLSSHTITQVNENAVTTASVAGLVVEGPEAAEASSEVSAEVFSDHNSVTPSLEERFYNSCFQAVDVNAKIDFQEYLSPNEVTPIYVKEHLDLMDERGGLIVSTGTERSFFDLALSDPNKCEGLVVRDINPRVKAYVDFNTMLLRISKDRNEYVTLSGDIQQDDIATLEQRLLLIKAKILQDDKLPPCVSQYYLANLQDFAKVYFSVSKKIWRGPHSQLQGYAARFEHVKYDQDERLFAVLQSYAKAGRIIATVGDINDLRFLEKQTVAIVDISNISQYIGIDFQGGEDFHPRVIWTLLGNQTKYYSYVHEPMISSDREEMDSIITKLIDIGVLDKENPLQRMSQDLLLGEMMTGAGCCSDRFSDRCIDYSKETLNRMRKFQSEALPILAGSMDRYRIWHEQIQIK